MFFVALGTWCFLCFLGQVTVPPMRGGGGLQEVGDYKRRGGRCTDAA